MSGKVELRVEELLDEILKDTDFETVDVEYVKEKDWYLRIFIDKTGGILEENTEDGERLLVTP